VTGDRRFDNLDSLYRLLSQSKNTSLRPEPCSSDSHSDEVSLEAVQSAAGLRALWLRAKSDLLSELVSWVEIRKTMRARIGSHWDRRS
jgi:hypothetical protein